MNSIPTSKQMSTESPLVIHTGSLLSNLDQETQARVLELRYMKHPLVEGKTPFAKAIQENLKIIGYYDVKQGRFIRTRFTQGARSLGPVGCITSFGYIRVQLNNINFQHSHLVCLWFTGELPSTQKQVDHIDGDTSNDFPGNLRIVLPEINSRNMKLKNNNTSGCTGVRLSKGKWEAFVRVNGIQIYLGRFIDYNNAVIARKNYISNNTNLGFTARHGT